MYALTQICYPADGSIKKKKKLRFYKPNVPSQYSLLMMNGSIFFFEPKQEKWPQ